MTESADFADRIRERFPHGLTAIFAVGGTRTSFILNNNRQADDPGRIDFQRYGEAMLARIQEILRDFFDLGGQNVIIPVLSYQSVENLRGEEYAERTAHIAQELISARWSAFYREMSIDPYFVGIDTLLRFPDKRTYYALGLECEAFNNNWTYEAGRRKVVFEIAPIPLYSFWRAGESTESERMARLAAELQSATNLNEVHDNLYTSYAETVYGTSLPIPDLYLGTSRNGDFKLRAMLPISLMCGSSTRFYFTPYPTILITQEAQRTILEDLAFGERVQSMKLDYAGRFSAEMLESEYERVQRLVSDPHSTLGLLRTNPTSGDE